MFSKLPWVLEAGRLCYLLSYVVKVNMSTRSARGYTDTQDGTTTADAANYWVKSSKLPWSLVAPDAAPTHRMFSDRDWQLHVTIKRCILDGVPFKALILYIFWDFITQICFHLCLYPINDFTPFKEKMKVVLFSLFVNKF